MARQSTCGKICFNNGVYHAATHVFEPWSTARETTHTFVTAGEFPERPSQEVINHVFRVLFLDALVAADADAKGEAEGIERASNLLAVLSRGLFGHVEDKRWLMMLGLRNSGKGVLIAALLAAFGSGYVRDTNSGNLMVKDSRGDSAKILSWMAAVIHCRLAYSNEVSAAGSSETVDGNAVKKMASGGDAYTYRTNYTDEVTRVPSFIYVLACNERPDIKPNDAYQTCSIYEFQNEFLEEAKFRQAGNNKRARLADTNTKTLLCNDPEYRAAIIWLIIEAYCDKPVRSEVVEVETKDILELDGSMNIQQVVDAAFEFDESYGFMSHADIKSIVDEFADKNCPKSGYEDLSVQKRSQVIKGFGAKAERQGQARGLTGLRPRVSPVDEPAPAESVVDEPAPAESMVDEPAVGWSAADEWCDDDLAERWVDQQPPDGY
jgi:hypothetical protein